MKVRQYKTHGSSYLYNSTYNYDLFAVIENEQKELIFSSLKIERTKAVCNLISSKFEFLVEKKEIYDKYPALDVLPDDQVKFPEHFEKVVEFFSTEEVPVGFIRRSKGKFNKKLRKRKSKGKTNS